MVESTDFEVSEAARLLAAVADPIRLELIHTLAKEGTTCVCNLQTDPPIADNLLSYHLKVLRSAGIVQSQRRGRWIDYRLNDDILTRLHAALPKP